MKTINKINTGKTLLQNRFIIAAAIVLLCVIAIYIYASLTRKSKTQKESEAIIRQAAAAQLNKDPNKVTNKDFAAVKTLDLSGKKVYDIGLLRKFTNLEELNLNSIPLPEPDIPEWMVVLGKLHVIDLYKIYYKSYKDNYFIDLSPLENLSDLKILYISNTALKDLKPLAKIKNLQEINADIKLLDDHGIFKQGVFPKTVIINGSETVIINGKEFNLEIEHITNNSKGTLPTIKVFIPGYNGTVTQFAEIRIKSEVEKALK